MAVLVICSHCLTWLFFFWHVKVDLLNGTVVDSTLLLGAGRLPVYSLNPNTYLDFAVDELGLWVIHADPEYGGNLVITKIDKGAEYLLCTDTEHTPVVDVQNIIHVLVLYNQ